jgi:hypothetical protein
MIALDRGHALAPEWLQAAATTGAPRQRHDERFGHLV